MSQPDPRQTVALFRYGLIAEFIHLPPHSPGLYAKLQAKAEAAYTIPGSTRTRVAAETLRDWLKAYCCSPVYSPGIRPRCFVMTGGGSTALAHRVSESGTAKQSGRQARRATTGVAVVRGVRWGGTRAEGCAGLG